MKPQRIREPIRLSTVAKKLKCDNWRPKSVIVEYINKRQLKVSQIFCK